MHQRYDWLIEKGCNVMNWPWEWGNTAKKVIQKIVSFCQ